jgi:hypothetical protein
MSTAAPSFPFTGRFKKAVLVLEPRRRQRLREAKTKIHGYAPERSQHRLLWCRCTRAAQTRRWTTVRAPRTGPDQTKCMSVWSVTEREGDTSGKAKPRLSLSTFSSGRPLFS